MSSSSSSSQASRSTGHPGSSAHSGGRNNNRNGNNNNNNRNRNKDDSPEVRLSKALSWLLRHNAVAQGVAIRPDGYVKVEDVLKHHKFKGFSLDDIRAVVANNSKKRFQMNEENGTLLIRAVQGHSIEEVMFRRGGGGLANGSRVEGEDEMQNHELKTDHFYLRSPILEIKRSQMHLRYLL